MSLVRLASVLRRYAALIAVCVLVSGLIGVGTALWRKRTYTATVAFVPNSKRSAPSVSGLAAQFGVSLATSSGASSPEFYLELIKSREVLNRVALGAYVEPPRRSAVTLPELMSVQGDSLYRLAEARRYLAKAIRTSLSQRGGVVSIAVTTTSARLSQTVATQLLAALDEFNRGTQREQSEAERRFAELRLAEAKSFLESAEGELQRFRERNKVFIGTSSLSVEDQRLERQVNVRQTLYVSVVQAYEQARIEAVRDFSPITVIDRPELPDSNSRGILVFGAFAALLGALVAILFMLLREYALEMRRGGGGELDEFATVGRRGARPARQPGASPEPSDDLGRPVM